MTDQQIKQIQRGMREMEILTDYLNDIIIKTGHAIRRDNHGLWKRFFNHYNNEDWAGMLAAMELLHEEYPESFQAFHTQAMRDAGQVLLEKGHNHRRILDTGPYKTTAWRTGMAIREVMNHLNGVHLPNV